MTLLVTTGKKPNTELHKIKVQNVFYNPSLNEVHFKRPTGGWDTLGGTDDIYAFEVRAEDD